MTRELKRRIKLLAVADAPRCTVEAHVHQDGRVFLSESGWKRLHHPDPRIATRTAVELRGSIDQAPLSLEGIVMRAPNGYIEITCRSEGKIAAYYVGGKLHSTATGTQAPRHLAKSLIQGRVGTVVADPDPVSEGICPQCGNTGKIDIGACTEPRCIERRNNQPPAVQRRLVHR